MSKQICIIATVPTGPYCFDANNDEPPCFHLNLDATPHCAFGFSGQTEDEAHTVKSPECAGASSQPKVVRAYDAHIRLLCSHLSAFLSHHRYPEFHNLPDLAWVEESRDMANDFNVYVFEQGKKK